MFQILGDFFFKLSKQHIKTSIAPEIHKFIVVYRLASRLKHLAAFDFVRALPGFQTTHHKDTSLVIRDDQLTIG